MTKEEFLRKSKNGAIFSEYNEDSYSYEGFIIVPGNEDCFQSEEEIKTYFESLTK